jgi:hypothetical protein
LFKFLSVGNVFQPDATENSLAQATRGVPALLGFVSPKIECRGAASANTLAATVLSGSKA